MAIAIRLGIIGAGLAVKRLHWPALRLLKDYYQIVAIADIDRARAKGIAELTGAQYVFNQYNDLLSLEDVEAVLIAVPIHLTHQITSDAIAAEKHVIVEKPPGANLDQVKLLKDQAASSPVTLLVAENFRYRGDLLAAQRVITSGAIGKPILARLSALSKVDTRDPQQFASAPWRQQPSHSGGYILDGGVHHAAALRDLFGEVESLQAFTEQSSPVISGPTTIIMNLMFRSGVIASYNYSVVCLEEHPTFLDLRVYGTKGTLEVRDGIVRSISVDGVTEFVYANPDDRGYYGEFLNFYQAIREGEPVIATLEKSHKDMELVLGAIASAESRSMLFF